MNSYFFIVPSKARVNAILRSDIYRHVMQSSDVRAVIFSHWHDDQSFRDEFGGKNVSHRPLRSINRSVMSRIALRLRERLLKVDNAITRESALIMQSVQDVRIIRTPSLLQRVHHTVLRSIKPLRPLIAWCFDHIEFALLRDKEYTRALRELVPQAIVVGTLGVVPDDLLWIVHARRFNTPACAVDLPWNYFEDRTLATPRLAHMCVWNDAMHQRAVRDFGIPHEYVHITGCVRYDLYTRSFLPAPRTETASRLGTDPSRPLIAYFLGTPPWHTSQPIVVEWILKAIRAGHIAGNPQLLVRFGPFQKPDEAYHKLAAQYKGDLILNTLEEMSGMYDMPNILHYCAVTLSNFSSTALDAAVLDRPAVYVGFAGHDQPHPTDPVIARVFDFDFIRQALDTGGVHVARNAVDLKEFINNGLSYPAKYAEGRRRLIRHYLGELGGAGQRIADVVLSL